MRMAVIQAWDARLAQSPPWMGYRGLAMKGVPRWFQVVAYVLAVGFSLWIGLHIHIDDSVPWIAIYATAAIVSALLPAHRVVGFVGLALGIAIGAWGLYLLRDVWEALRLDKLVETAGGPLGGGREAIVLAVALVWLVLGSAFRTQRA
jgi:hypothetical protein